MQINFQSIQTFSRKVKDLSPYSCPVRPLPLLAPKRRSPQSVQLPSEVSVIRRPSYAESRDGKRGMAAGTGSLVQFQGSRLRDRSLKKTSPRVLRQDRRLYIAATMLGRLCHFALTRPWGV